MSSGALMRSGSLHLLNMTCHTAGAGGPCHVGAAPAAAARAPGAGVHIFSSFSWYSITWLNICHAYVLGDRSSSPSKPGGELLRVPAPPRKQHPDFRKDRSLHYYMVSQVSAAHDTVARSSGLAAEAEPDTGRQEASGANALWTERYQPRQPSQVLRNCAYTYAMSLLKPYCACCAIVPVPAHCRCSGRAAWTSRAWISYSHSREAQSRMCVRLLAGVRQQARRGRAARLVVGVARCIRGSQRRRAAAGRPLRHVRKHVNSVAFLECWPPDFDTRGA